MADSEGIKISSLPSAGTLNGTETLFIERAGVPLKTTPIDVMATSNVVIEGAIEATNSANEAVIEANTARDAANAAANAGGSPKGSYTTFALLNSAYPSGATGIYLVNANGHWYFWNSSIWADGGVYLGSLPVQTTGQDTTVSMSQKSATDTFELKSNTQFINVTTQFPVAEGTFHTASTARIATIPVKKKGLVITYETSAGVWVTEQNINDDLSSWVTYTNWENKTADNLAKAFAAEFASVRALNPNYTFIGFVKAGSTTVATEGNVYTSTEACTINSVSLAAGTRMLYNGVAWTKILNPDKVTLFSSNLIGFVENSVLRKAVKSIKINSAIEGYQYVIKAIGKNLTTYNEQFLFLRKDIITSTETAFSWNTTISNKSGVREVILLGTNAIQGSDIAPDIILLLDFNEIPDGVTTATSGRMIINPLFYSYASQITKITASLAAQISSVDPEKIVPDIEFIPAKITSTAALGGIGIINGLTIPIGYTGNGSYINIFPDFLNDSVFSELNGETIEIIARIKLVNYNPALFGNFTNTIYGGGLTGTTSISLDVPNNILIAKITCMCSNAYTNQAKFYIKAVTTGVMVGNDFSFIVEKVYVNILTYTGVKNTEKIANFKLRKNLETLSILPLNVSDIYLPAIIPVANGVELNIYTDALRKISDEKELDSKIFIASELKQNGYQKRGRFNYCFNQAETGTFNITAIQKSHAGKSFGKLETSIVKRVPNNAGSGTLNILAIGDSITNRGISFRELQNLFFNSVSLGGANINFFGTVTNTAANANNPHNFGTIKSECRSGWFTDNFITASRFKSDGFDGANPFWNVGRAGGADVDLLWYIAQLNAGTYAANPILGIDVFMITLGTNDMAIQHNTTTQYIANINTIITKVWRDYPNCKIVICGVPPLGVNGAYKSTIIDYNNVLDVEFSVPRSNGVSGKCIFAPVAFWIDRERGYGLQGTSRIPNETTIIPENTYYGDLHPFLLGCYQLADAQFSGIQYVLSL